MLPPNKSLYLTFLSLLLSYVLASQNYSGTRLYNASKNIELSVYIDGDLDEVTLTMKGPTNVWFAFGFGVNRMTNAYTIVSDGNGNISERKLGNHNAGSSLTNSFTFTDYSTNGNVATTVVKRPLSGLNSNYYSFGKSEQSIPIIWAYGSGANLSSHARRGISTIAIQQECLSTQSNITETSCAPYTSPSGKKFNASGNYQDIISNSAGCDSVISIDLTILPNPTRNQNTSACTQYTSPSGKYVWTESGTYSDTLTQVTGCDSIITIDLTIIDELVSDISVESCVDYTSPSGKYTYSVSGEYSDTLTSSQGCDSIITIDLTIIDELVSDISVESCVDYTSPSGKYTYSVSGEYSDTLTSSQGCDSIITIDLTIIDELVSDISVESCVDYTSPSGKYTYSVSGEYSDTLTSSQGCDSIITIDLTIIDELVSDISVESCVDYTSPSGKYTYSVSGEYSDTLTSSQGCDSIITIDLTIIDELVSDISVESCVDYTSPSGKYTYSVSGEYSDTLASSQGCDSIITIDLTIIDELVSDISVEACVSYTSPSGKYIYTESGQYSDTLRFSSSCDSIFSIDLTIINPDTSVTQNDSELISNATNSSFQWLDCQNDFEKIAGETNARFVSNTDGLFAVEVNNNGCLDTSACYAISLNSIAEINSSTIKISQSEKFLSISFDHEVNLEELQILNSIGQVVAKQKHIYGYQIQIDLTEKTGLFFLFIQYKNGAVAQKKFILQN